MMNRRLFLALAGSLPLRAAPFSKPIGINLYTVRNSLAKDPAGTYKALHALGIRELEVRAVQLQDHGQLIRQNALKPKHMFLDSAVVTGDWEASIAMQRAMAKRMNLPEPKSDAPRPTLAAMAQLAKEFGIERLGISYLLPGERPKAIEHINRATDELAKLGLGFYYHNHAWEFESGKGTRFLDQLHKEADPRVKLELDLFWATVGGDDPVKLLETWKGRVASLHMKDVASNAPRQRTEMAIPPTAFKEIGAGILDWPRILSAAATAGVEHYFIEQDFTEGDPIDSVRRSIAYLKQVEIPG